MHMAVMAVLVYYLVLLDYIMVVAEAEAEAAMQIQAEYQLVDQV
jgi:hypothetical protein